MDMKERLMKLKGKKDKMPMSDTEKTAKMNVLGGMKSAAEDMMKGKLGGLKKVTVAAPDSSGLEHGLEKAKEMIDGEQEPEEMGVEEIDAKIAELMAMKAKMTGEHEHDSEESEESEEGQESFS